MPPGGRRTFAINRVDEVLYSRPEGANDLDREP
jgi:hypothetical protein